MTRKCNKCGHVSVSLFRKKNRCHLCGGTTQKKVCRKLEDTKEPFLKKELK